MIGNRSPVEHAADGGDRALGDANDPGAERGPVILPGFSDSRWFRDAFPGLRRLWLLPAAPPDPARGVPLIHNADERIDVRDLGFAASFYADLARELLGGD